MSSDPLHGRTEPLARLGWLDWARYVPDFLGYPIHAFAIVMALSTTVILIEGAGVALVYPIIEIMQSGNDPGNIAAHSAIFRSIMDVLGILGVPPALNALMLCAAVVVLLRQIFNYVNATLRAEYNYTAVERISSRTFRLFTQANIGYSERYRSGTMINAILTEAKRAGTLAAAWQTVASCVLRIVIYAVLLLVISWQAAVAGAVLLGLVTIVLSRRSIRSAMQTGQRIARANDSLARYALEKFNLIYLMKISGTDAHEADDFARRMASLRRLNVQVNRQAARLDAFIEGAVVIGGLSLVYTANTVLGMSFAALAVFLIAVLRLMPVAKELAVSAQQIAVCTAAVRYLDNLNLEAVAARQPDSGRMSFPKLSHAVRFDNVSFDYRGQDAADTPIPALHALTVDIPVGSTTALVGPSGAGKSTFMDLLARLREPSGGQILFDAVPGSDIRLHEFHQNLTVVSQEALVLDGTVAENLRYGNPGADDEAIVAAAKAAYAHDFIMRLAAGYDTIVGERGVLLSGGQKQRLALARAFIGQAQVLLLDEPTSALDAESELAVQKALADIQVARKMTVVIIAHRLSTVRHADRIIVLDKGRLLGCGTHEELIATAPWYNHIVNLQLGSAEPPQQPTVAPLAPSSS